MTISHEEFEKNFAIIEGKLALEKKSGKVFVPVVLDDPQGHLQLVKIEEFEKNRDKISKQVEDFLSKITPKE